MPYDQALDVESFKEVKELPRVTSDGVPFNLMANIEVPDEVEDAIENGAQGIGLFRTEYLYIGREDIPSEEEQYRHYRNVIERMQPFPVSIRTIDIGGDKFLSSLKLPIESNPFMGERAIRLCLSRKELFRPQLRAILRAAYYGNASMLLPMIGGLNELVEAKRFIREVARELKKEKKRFNGKIKIGAMIEIPSAALRADILAKEVDYFSIGTNDLVQYTLAVDRVNDKVAHLYQPLHPAVLKLIQMTIASAKRYNIPLTVCGEMDRDS